MGQSKCSPLDVMQHLALGLVPVVHGRDPWVHGVERGPGDLLIEADRQNPIH